MRLGTSGCGKDRVHVENPEVHITDSQRECVEEEKIQGPGLRFCPVGLEGIQGFKGQ